MQSTSKAEMLRLGGVSANIASLLFLLTVVHVLSVLPLFGFRMEMLDDRSMLLPWVSQHSVAYGLLWQLYFVSQLFLLPVPLALYTFAARESLPAAGAAAGLAVIGTAATTLAMVGIVVIYSTSPTVAHAYLAAVGSSQANTLLLGDLFADLGKEIRLFSELLLGFWIGGTAVILFRQGRTSGLIWLLMLVGAYTCIVAIVKIFNPFNPLEDTLGFLLAVAYLSIGWLLLRREPTNIAAPQPA